MVVILDLTGIYFKKKKIVFVHYFKIPLMDIIIRLFSSLSFCNSSRIFLWSRLGDNQAGGKCINHG